MFGKYHLSGVVFLVFLVCTPLVARGAEVADLQQQIDARRATIDALQKQIDQLRQAVTVKQTEKQSLNNQLSIIGSRLEKTRLNIEQTQNKLKETSLKKQQTELIIAEKKDLIARQQAQISELVRALDFSDRQSLITILASGKTLSDFFTTRSAYEAINDQLAAALVTVKNTKKELEQQQATLAAQETDLNKLDNSLSGQKESLHSQSVAKTQLLTETKASEARFQKMITDLKRQYAAIESEINGIEKEIKARLKSGALKVPTGDVALRWPSLSQVVTATFHDPDYPFRNIFEHSGIDIRSAQGTSVRAAGAGVVARAKNAGRGYSYVIIVHNNTISTLYGHLSRIDVREDEVVSAGEIIGLSGGKPGSPGAGPFVTGPHLHFEVRQEGIPVNPLDYLP